jgi:hypothetical protein
MADLGCSVLQAGSDIFRFQVRVVPENFLFRQTGREQIENVLDRMPELARPPNAEALDKSPNSLATHLALCHLCTLHRR